MCIHDLEYILYAAVMLSRFTVAKILLNHKLEKVKENFLYEV